MDSSEVTRGWILTHSCSKHAESPQDVPYGDLTDD